MSRPLARTLLSRLSTASSSVTSLPKTQARTLVTTSSSSTLTTTTTTSNNGQLRIHTSNRDGRSYKARQLAPRQRRFSNCAVRAVQKTGKRAYAAVVAEAEQEVEEGEGSEAKDAAQATAQDGEASDKDKSKSFGPLDQYEKWVNEGRLKDDPYQRGIVSTLQVLHHSLRDYNPQAVVKPELVPVVKKKSLLSSFFGRKPAEPENPYADMPKGLYLFGDVGSGKTMLMDMFYNTLPTNINSKTRIHFHHFMQDVHKRMHKFVMAHGNDMDAIPFVAADIAEEGRVLCFDEFQCTDVADAMILRRLIEALMSHGVVIIATSNRHPDELYKNGIQRGSFLPCIDLLKTSLHVVNLDSPTDYRKVPRPSSGVYHHPLDKHATIHINKWFTYLGDPTDPPAPRTHTVWGRPLHVPFASGRAAKFDFHDLCGGSKSAADYIELTKHYSSFLITSIPQMTHHQRDLARRFITLIDTLYESKARLIMTSAVPLRELFISKAELAQAAGEAAHANHVQQGLEGEESGEELDAAMRNLMDDLGLNMTALKNTSIFSGDEERFAFARALSRLTEMGGVTWGGE